MIRFLSGATPAEREAIEWLVRLQEPQREVDPFIAFQAWLESDPEHRKAYDHVQTLWDELSTDELRRALDGHRAGTTRVRALGALAVVTASVAAAVVISGAVQGQEKLYQSAPGAEREVALKDGTTLSLKAGSEVRVRLGWRKRDAVLTRGEALFDVAHDTSRPFKVRVSDHQIDVLGTAFDVKQRADGFQVTVLRGHVRVSPQAGGEGVAMERGDHYDNRAGLSARVVRGAPQDIDQWKAGRRVYRDSPLAAVVADLNTTMDRRVVLDPSAEAIRFSGVLQVNDDASVLKQLEAVLPIRVTKTLENVRLSARS